MVVINTREVTVQQYLYSLTEYNLSVRCVTLMQRGRVPLGAAELDEGCVCDVFGSSVSVDL